MDSVNNCFTDLVENRGFYNFYKKLPEKSETTIRFFNRVDYYTVHGSDALFVAKEVFKSMSSVKVFGSENAKCESLVLNKHQFESLIKELLLVRQYRIEVYSLKAGPKGNDWFLEHKASPGNFSAFENIIFDSEFVTGAAVMGIKLLVESKARIVGVAIIDVTEQEISMCQFEDDDNFTDLEGLIVCLSPKEIIVPNLPEYKSIFQIAVRCGGLLVKLRPTAFASGTLREDLKLLLHWDEGQTPNASALPEMKLTAAKAALSAVIKYLELPQKASNFKLSTCDKNRFVHVDTASAKALGLIPQQSSAIQETLFDFLNKCRTPQGRRLLSQWVKQPLKDLRLISERHDIVSAFRNARDTYSSLSNEHLRWFPDLQLLARKLQKKTCSLQECYKIYRAVERIPPLLAELKQVQHSAAVKENFIGPLQEFEASLAKYQEMIAYTLDMDLVAKGEYLVKADFSEELTELKSSLEYLEKEIQRELHEAARELFMEAGKVIKLETTSHYGFHFRISNKKEEPKIRNNVKFKILDYTNAGVRFQSTTLAALNEDYAEKKKNYDDCQKIIVNEFLDIAVSFVEQLQALNNVIAKLDVLVSFTLVAASSSNTYVRPLMRPMEDGVLKLKAARHPILESQKEHPPVIPNDVALEKNGITFCVITGPNMGGKSTYIRTVGLTVLMAHIGSFVPCTEAEISLKDSILARIGSTDRQSIGVSTFMNEMMEINIILKKATENSLVMIDELGRGTSTYEGCGIAYAISSHLASEVKAFCLFATHFHELVNLADEFPSVANYHVTARTEEEDKLIMEYTLLPGPSNRSFGLDVAKMAGFQSHVIEDARQKLLELDQEAGLCLNGDHLSLDEIKEGKKYVNEFFEKIKNKGIEEIKLAKEEILRLNNRYVTAILS